MAEDRDIVDVLHEEHETIRERFRVLKSTPTEHREDNFHALVRFLAGHEAAEEAVVHRAFRDEVPETDQVFRALLEEEADAEELLAQMVDTDPTSDRFAEQLLALERAVLAHAEHEEADELPLLQVHLDEDRRRQMGRRFLQLRDAGPTRPHPDTPHTPEVRAVAGPLVGAFDRARDAVRAALD